MIPVRLIIVDDDPAVRAILRSVVEDLGADVLAEADNGRAAIEQAERHRPEVMLLDISMPIMGGFPAARYLREHLPEVRIIVVSQFNEKVYADEAIEVGARGYVFKAAAATELSVAMNAVVNGGTFISPCVCH